MRARGLVSCRDRLRRGADGRAGATGLWIAHVVLACLGLGTSPVVAQNVDVPADLQVSMLSKIFQFDRAFKDRVGNEVVVGITHQRLHRPSVLSGNELLDTSHRSLKYMQGIPVRIVRIEASTFSELEDALQREAVDILFVTPLRSIAPGSIGEMAGGMGIATVTAVTGYADDGIGIGLATRGDRLEIVVNKEACEAAGVEFSSQLLKLARVVAGE